MHKADGGNFEIHRADPAKGLSQFHKQGGGVSIERKDTQFHSALKRLLHALVNVNLIRSWNCPVKQGQPAFHRLFHHYNAGERISLVCDQMLLETSARFRCVHEFTEMIRV